MSIPFRQAPFKTSGGTTARSLDDWFSDVVNVREFASLKEEGSGTMGDGTGNDAPCIQAAFDEAFGDPPNGWDNRHLNRPVFIPRGKYRCTDQLNLTKVVGGHIYGAGKHSTQIYYQGDTDETGVTRTAMLNMNGCADLCIEKLYIEMPSNTLDDYSCTIAIDWDGDDSGNGCDGNHSNHFQELAIGRGQYGVIIGSDAASEGHDNLFLNCSVVGNVIYSQIGIDVVGPNADNNHYIGGSLARYNIAHVRCPTGGGSIHIQGIGSGYQGGTMLEYIMESGKVMTISQCRSETPTSLRMENGIVIIQGITGSTGTINYAECNGGKLIMQGCTLHHQGQIIGTGGELYIAGCEFGLSTTPLSGYSGTVVWNPDEIPD